MIVVNVVNKMAASETHLPCGKTGYPAARQARQRENNNICISDREARATQQQGSRRFDKDNNIRISMIRTRTEAVTMETKMELYTTS